MRTARMPMPQFEAPRLESSVARAADVVAAAQRLREGGGAGAQLTADRFDMNCDYIAVRDVAEERVIAACRVVSPRDALRAGGGPAADAFDVALLIVLRDRLVEVDRPAMDPRYPADAVLAMLWSAIARYLIDHGLDYVLAAPEVSARDGGHIAASIFREHWVRAMSPEDYRVFPHRRLPLETLSDTRAAAPPAVLRSYLERGAWVCGEPAHDASREQAAFPLLLPLARMQEQNARRFLADAA